MNDRAELIAARFDPDAIFFKCPVNACRGEVLNPLHPCPRCRLVFGDYIRKVPHDPHAPPRR